MFELILSYMVLKGPLAKYFLGKMGTFRFLVMSLFELIK